MPHGIPSLCGDVFVTIDDNYVLQVPRNQVPSFFSSRNFTGMVGLDSDFDKELVHLEYFGEDNSKNLLTVTVGERNFKFRDITCMWE